MGARRIRIRRLQRVNRLLGKQAAGAAKIVKQIGIVGVLGQRGLQVFYRWLQLPSPDLRDPQCRLLLNLLQMRNRLGVVALRQQRVSQQLVRGGQIRRQFKSMLEGRDGGAVILILHVGLAQIYEAFRQRGREFRHFLEFGDGNVEVALLLGLRAGLQMLQRLGRDGLPRQPKHQQDSDHGFSGSRTSRNWSA